MAFAQNSFAAPMRDKLFAATSLLVVSIILYYGRTLLIPMLLAVLLSFMLTPFVVALQKKGVHRIAAVLIVMTIAIVAIGGLLMAVFAQVNTLVMELPEKQGHIITKIRDVTGGPGPSVLGTLSKFLDELNKNVQDKGSNQDKTAIPVTIQPTPSNWLNLPTIFSTVQHILGFVLLTVGLCASMLVKREDLRNRLITLIGQGHVTSTTKAMEEATRRMSSYLLTQFMLNAAFGVIFGLGLMVLNVDYALLWGLLATVLRFIPGLGTWMAAVPPLLVSLTVEGWATPVLVILWALALGVAFNYIVEPILVSRRTGLSMVSLVLMAAFWTWLWGLPGLVLATPISVCLLVLGSHIPAFHFLYVMLAEDSVMGTDLSFYQRLLADDQDEAVSLLETYLEDHSEQEMAEAIIIPTLAHALEDEQNKLLTHDDLVRILDRAEKAVEHVMPLGPAEMAEEVDEADPRALILGCATHDERETLALTMMKALLPPTAGRMEVIGDRATVSEVLQHIRKLKPTLVCLVAIPPRGYNQPRMRCKRIRSLFPDLPVVIGLWGMPGDHDKDDQPFLDAGATAVTWSLRETLDTILPKLRLATHQIEEGVADEKDKAGRGTLVGTR